MGELQIDGLPDRQITRVAGDEGARRAQVARASLQRDGLGVDSGLHPSLYPGSPAPLRHDGSSLGVDTRGGVRDEPVRDIRLVGPVGAPVLEQVLEVRPGDVLFTEQISPVELGEIFVRARLDWIHALVLRDELLQPFAKRLRRLEKLHRDAGRGLRACLLCAGDVNDLRLQHHRLAAEAELQLDLDQVAWRELLSGADEGASVDDVLLELLPEFDRFIEGSA